MMSTCAVFHDTLNGLFENSNITGRPAPGRGDFHGRRRTRTMDGCRRHDATDPTILATERQASRPRRQGRPRASVLATGPVQRPFAALPCISVQEPGDAGRAGSARARGAQSPEFARILPLIDKRCVERAKGLEPSTFSLGSRRTTVANPDGAKGYDDRPVLCARHWPCPATRRCTSLHDRTPQRAPPPASVSRHRGHSWPPQRAAGAPLGRAGDARGRGRAGATARLEVGGGRERTRPTSHERPRLAPSRGEPSSPRTSRTATATCPSCDSDAPPDRTAR